MAIMSDLSGELVEEILSRVRLRSLRIVRSTCKTWNGLSKTLVLGQKSVKKEFMAFTVIRSRIQLLRFELQGIRNEDYKYNNLADSYLKQISIPHRRQVQISQVFHCDGLLLCVLQVVPTQLLVWNPYLGQTSWLGPVTRDRSDSTSDMYAIGYGYENKNRNHKILRFSSYYFEAACTTRYPIDVFDIRSASWKVLYVNPIPGVNFRELFFQHRSVSLKGNTYFCVQEEGTTERKDSLLCFDFTTEKFGPFLPLPQPYAPQAHNVTLSCVRDEKIALLYTHYKTSNTIVIWITTNIEPIAVSWTKFLTLDMKPQYSLLNWYWIFYNLRSFFIDEENKVAVFFNITVPKSCPFRMAYIIGEDGYFKSVNMGKKWWVFDRTVCSSYVPSLVQLA